MPRKPRELYAGEYYHFTCRGNNKGCLFHCENDYEYFLASVRQYQEKFTIVIHNYCLMPNHVHLLLKAVRDGFDLIKFMHGLLTRYAKAYQLKYQKTGHIFERRYRDHHIDSEAYLLECGRYIERNPVRAGIVASEADYRWSSYAFYVFGDGNKILTPHLCFLGLADTDFDRRQLYRAYLQGDRPYDYVKDQCFFK